MSLLVDADVAEEMSEEGPLAANWATDTQAFFQHDILDEDMLDDSRTIAAAMGADVVVGRKSLGEDVYVQALPAALRNTTPVGRQQRRPDGHPSLDGGLVPWPKGSLVGEEHDGEQVHRQREARRRRHRGARDEGHQRAAVLRDRPFDGPARIARRQDPLHR